MIPALGVFVALLFLGEAVLFAFGRLSDLRAEQAYWRIRDQRPAFYDWAEEPDL